MARLHCLNRPIAHIKAVDNYTAAKKANEGEAGGLHSSVFLSEGARVMLSCNLWTERGLVNGSMGTVAAILYRSGGPPDLSVAVMVQFDKYSGPTWGGDRCVTISSITRTWRSPNVKSLCDRIGFARESHKSAISACKSAYFHAELNIRMRLACDCWTFA